MCPANTSMLMKRCLSGQRIDQREMLMSDMLPYSAHYDDQTVITKSHAAIQVIKLDGLYFESYSAQQIKQFEAQRNTILHAIAASNRAIYVHLIRRKVQDYPAYPKGTWFARQFNQAWKRHYQQQSFFVNDIYISIVVNPVRQGVPGLFDQCVAFFTGKKRQPETNDLLQQQIKEVHEVSRFLLQAFSEYGARQLGIQHLPCFNADRVASSIAYQEMMRFQQSWELFTQQFGATDTYEAHDVIAYLGESYTEIGSFFYYLVNLQSVRVPVSTLPLDQLLAMSAIDTHLLGSTLAVHHDGETRLVALMSMAQWPAQTSSNMLDAFMYQPVEFIMTQSFFFHDRITAEHELRQERRRLRIQDNAGDTNEDASEITQGIQDLTHGRTVNGLHHLSLLVHALVDRSLSTQEQQRYQASQQLDQSIARLQQAFVHVGVKPVREWFAAETFYWAQLPGQAAHLMGRRGSIQSKNFAGFISLHNFATGKLHHNLWGDAVMPFETESGTAYYFNFHREIEGMVSGHTAFAADSGAGKTTLLSALITMVDKVSPKVFWFDHRCGATVFIHAMGGQHTTLNPYESMRWNPFQLADTTENRQYLIELLTLMATCYGRPITEEDIQCFQQAIKENYLLPRQDRRLRHIAWCFGRGELSQVMQIWHGANGEKGAYADVFDHETDQFDVERCRHHCFEMQYLMKDGGARPELAVMLSYPFHRIEQSLNGDPCIVVLEEGQHLVTQSFWREKIDYYIMQIRRKNGIVIFVTPDAKYLFSETDTIQKQTVTKIFLPNKEANYHDYVEQLGLTEAEYHFIRHTPTACRKFLIKRGTESVRAIFDLTPLSSFIPILSSNAQSVQLMYELMSQLQSTDPEVWVPVFMQKVKEINTHNLYEKELLN